jgi:hypothetical protein
VGIEELRLGLAAVDALAIPPTGTIGVDDGAIGCLDGDTGSRDLDERATPLFVAESSGSIKDDLELSQELGQRDASRNEGLYVIMQVRNRCVNRDLTYLSSILQVGQIEGLTRRHLDVVQYDGGARGLAGTGAGCRGERASRGRLLGQVRNTRRSGSRGDQAGSQGGQDEMLKVRWHFPSNGLVLFNRR